MSASSGNAKFRSCFEISQKFFYGSFRSVLSFFFQSDSRRYPFQKEEPDIPKRRTGHPRKQLIKFMSTNFKTASKTQSCFDFLTNFKAASKFAV